MHKGEDVLIVFNVHPGNTVNWAGYNCQIQKLSFLENTLAIKINMFKCGLKLLSVLKKI